MVLSMTAPVSAASANDSVPTQGVTQGVQTTDSTQEGQSPDTPQEEASDASQEDAGAPADVQQEEPSDAQKEEQAPGTDAEQSSEVEEEQPSDAPDVTEQPAQDASDVTEQPSQAVEEEQSSQADQEDKDDQSSQSEPAEQVAAADQEDSTAGEEAGEASDDTVEVEPSTGVAPTSVEININAAPSVPFYGETPFVVVLEKGNTRFEQTAVLQPTVGENGQEGASVSAVFSKVPNGVYTLTISAEGYTPYTQQIEVSGQIYTVRVYTDRLGGYTYGADDQHPGVLRGGDMNGDGKVDGTDVATIIAALEDGSSAAYDLNGNGVVDLIDLQMLAGSYEDLAQGTWNDSAFVTSSVPAAAGTDEDTVVTGDLDRLLVDSTAVVGLKPSNGEAISSSNPVVLGFAFSEDESSVNLEGMVIKTPGGTANAMTDGIITVELQDGSTVDVEVVPAQRAVMSRASNMKRAVIEADGTIVVDFGAQIAVKKVTIKVTATADSTSLAEISKVEFLNDMENRIPPPQMDVPENVQAEVGNKTFTVTWKPCVNVSGYEVRITSEGVVQTLRTATNSITVNGFDGDKLVNGTVYLVEVQSINGQWSSGFSPAIEVVPMVSEVPPAPDGLSLVGKFEYIEASWKDMDDTDTYNLYYREKGAESFTKVAGLESNSYTITGLKGGAYYEVYVTGVNDLGEGPASVSSMVKVASLLSAWMPSYNLINTPKEEGEVTAHIKNIAYYGGSSVSKMVGSSFESDANGQTLLGLADGNQGSYLEINDWDFGVAYHHGQWGVQFEFDGVQSLGGLALVEPENGSVNTVSMFYWDPDSGERVEFKDFRTNVRMDENNRRYLYISFNTEVNTDKVMLGFSTGYTRGMKIAEVRFYSFGELENNILNLFADNLYLTLREGVTEAYIEELRTQLNTVDPVSGEYHPNRALLLKELDNALGLLTTPNLEPVMDVDCSINNSLNGNMGFSGLNAWQPLGVTAHVGEQIVIYVGTPGGKPGDSTKLQLVTTQVYAESSALTGPVFNLKVGRNEITIPQIQTLMTEGGGALYIQYTGDRDADSYSVRVSGGAQIPTLNLHGITDKEERLALIKEYLTEMDAYAAQLEQLHGQLHQGSGIEAVDYDYNEQECILNHTDIVLDLMMYSLPVTQVLAGVGDGTLDVRAQKLCNALDAMDQMMLVFYQHKGLTNMQGAGVKNQLPKSHLNIRYMRMFAGAFMYASGNHIGIGWGSVTGMFGSKPITVNADGTYADGAWFGWGIAHEIGHDINQGVYSHAEVTNNYFAQLSQAHEVIRFSYADVYEKVTSGTTGYADNVFTQLALYWQLHLAYDKGYEYEIYDTYQAMFNGIFFARVDTYARDTKAAPAPNGVALTLTGDKDQNLMRLSCAAAQRDLTDFFIRWGMVPDAVTLEYAAQFEKETKALYYGDDASRDYRFTHEEAGSTILGQSVITEGTTAVVDEKIANQVNFTISSTVDPELLLGYEITRIIYENGKASSQVVGFTTDSTYVDTVSTMNNRVVTYQITAVDQFLNRSESITLEPVKISHDGSHDKSLWTVTTNMVSEADTVPPSTENDPCEPEVESAISVVVDNNKNTTYTGVAQSGQAVITLDFHKALEVTGLKYTVTSGTPIQSYEIEITADGTTWSSVASGSFAGGEVNTVYFQNADKDPWVCTYDAVQLRLTVQAPVGTEISISELDVLGPTGDNVELWANGIGYLEEEYRFAEGAEDVIPAGSLVFTGNYKGNPAYNVVLLYNEKGEIVGGQDSEGNLLSHQIILAPDPEDGMLGEVSEGYWVYWIEPQDLANVELPKSVRVELYRVDNAITNEGQRLTSDTLPVTVPDTLPGITIAGQDSDNA